MEHGLPIIIDDQESFREAILYNVDDLHSHIMRLYLASNQAAAQKIYDQTETMKP